jgi:hypothetical protein
MCEKIEDWDWDCEDDTQLPSINLNEKQLKEKQQIEESENNLINDLFSEESNNNTKGNCNENVCGESICCLKNNKIPLINKKDKLKLKKEKRKNK